MYKYGIALLKSTLSFRHQNLCFFNIKFVLLVSNIVLSGCADFVPICTEPSSQLGGCAASFESFGELLGRASEWTRYQQNVRITNVQSIDYKLPHEAGKKHGRPQGGAGGGAVAPPPLEFPTRCISDGLLLQKDIIYTIYLLF